MRAMVLRGKNLTVEDVPRPAPGPGQVLAKIRACGICGSDLHAARYMDDMRQTAQNSRRNAWYDQRDYSGGIVMGHEFVAEVVEAGPGAESWTPGMRVTSMPILMAPDTPTGFLSIGYSPEVPGGYAEYILMSSAFLLPVADNVSDDVAATTEPCAVGLHAVRESGIQPHQSALVMGAGPIGLMTLLWLKQTGVRYVAVSDYSAERRELAKLLGADDVFNPKEVDLAEELAHKLFIPAPGREDKSYGGGPITAAPDVVFECVGVPGTLQQAMDLVQVRGAVTVVGVCMEPDRITPLLGINKQITMKFVLGYSAAEYAEALQAFADGRVDTTPLVTRRVSLEELPGAFQALADPRDCKVLVVPGGA
ncbi:MAG: zinc-binding dehydrogenase [Dehalococcoidia bacterium]